MRIRSADPALHGLAYFRTPTDHEMVQLRDSTFMMLLEAERTTRRMLDELLPVLDQTPLDDLVAMIRSQLLLDLRQLEAIDDEASTTWQIGITAIELLSKTLKAAAALENAYCAEYGLESEITHVAELETAITIRQSYAKFWRLIDPAPPVDEAEVEERLRRASTAIARLCGRPIFLDIRFNDRGGLLQIQRRIRKSLAGLEQADPGMDLWHDLKAFSELLRMINQRAELVEHDTQQVPRQIEKLSALSPSSRPADDANLFQRLFRLLGRDAALDDLLFEPQHVTAADLLPVLRHIEAVLRSRF